MGPVPLKRRSGGLLRKRHPVHRWLAAAEEEPLRAALRHTPLAQRPARIGPCSRPSTPRIAPSTATPGCGQALRGLWQRLVSRPGALGGGAGPATMDHSKQADHKSLPPAKHVKDSICEMTELLLPSHCNQAGVAFGGQIMAWMDICGGTAAKRHSNCPVVTAGMDFLHFQNPVRLGEVVKIRAKVNRAFTTSMEIGVSVIGENPLTGETRFCCNGYFTFVAKKSGDAKMRVPAITPLTADEIREFKHAEERRAFRTRQQQQQQHQGQPHESLISPRPDLPPAPLLASEETSLSPSHSDTPLASGEGHQALRQSGPLSMAHSRRLGMGMARSASSMHLQAADREPDTAPLPTVGKTPEESAVEATQLVLPSHANTTGITFGGQIMAWMETCASISATKHARHFCIVVSADELHFLQPTYVGEAVTIRSVVTRLFSTSLEVAVSVDAENLLTGEERHCNTAFFTFVAVDEKGAYAPQAHIPALVPTTPEEIERYHAAARRRHVRLQHKHATAPLVDSILKSPSSDNIKVGM